MERMIDILRKFDYSENEAKVYITLLQNGAQNGYEVSKNSGVPRSRVYNILEKLVNKGIVVTSPQDKVVTYKAEPVERMIEIIKTGVASGIQELSEESKKFTLQEADDQMWHLDNYYGILSKAKEMIQQAQNELLIQIWEEELTPDLEALLLEKEKNLKVVVVLYDEHKNYTTSLKQIYKHGFEGDSLHDVGSRWMTIVADNQEMMYATIQNPSSARASYTRSSGMVFFAKEYVTHDAYCLRLIHYMPQEVKSTFGEDMEGIRDIFAIHK